MDFSQKSIKRVGDSIHVISTEVITDPVSLKKAIRTQIKSLEDNTISLENEIITNGEKIKDLKKLIRKIEELTEVINEEPAEVLAEVQAEVTLPVEEII